jgi:hypothetical protein
MDLEGMPVRADQLAERALVPSLGGGEQQTAVGVLGLGSHGSHKV